MLGDIEITAEYIIITLADGVTKIQLPTWKSFSELAAKVELLNADVAAIKILVEAWNQNDYIKSVTVLADGSGYMLEFVKSGKVTIYHGKNGSNGSDGAPGQDGSNGSDGKDGHSPEVSVGQDTDGVWYWTIDGEWLLDGSGNKVVAVGKDGAPGQNGANGTDGITPKFKIEDGFWYVSYDNCATWEIAGQATGNTGGEGAAGDSLFAAVDSANEDFIVVVLTDGRTLKFPTWKAFEELKVQCNQMNTNISSILALISSNDYVTGVSEIWDNGEVIGYTISFTKSKPIVIYHGKNGSDGKDGLDGYVPNIGLKQDTDGVWYWILDGEWLLDGNGQKVKASAKDGVNGTNGSNGQDGSNGKDGVTPRLKIDGGYWYISYDNGTSWEIVGQATGDKGDIGATGPQGPEGPQGPTGPEGPQGPAGTDGDDGKDGDTLISDIEITDDYVLITLADGQLIQIPTWAAHQALEQKVNQLNTNIESIQTILTALQNNDYVTGVTKIYEGGKEIGYTINFSKSGSVTIYHGKDGQNGSNGTNGTDGRTPAIAVKQDTDGVWYWTLDGEWLLDGNGQKVKASAKDGANGTNGSNGQDGSNGKDGVTPRLKIDGGYWYISYDNGTTWEAVGQATGDKGDIGETGPEGPQGPTGPEGPQGPAGSDGEDGKDGDTLISDIEITDDYVLITLADGKQIQIPTWAAHQALEQKVNQMNTNIEAIQTILTALQNNDYVTGVTKIYEGGKEIGYTITFSKSGSVTIYHGKDGQNGSNGTNGTDGRTPAIAVKQDTDGIWYWTIDGEWLLDSNGNKVKSVGTDGQNGANGSNGTDGVDGKDGVTPMLKIENGYWYVSYDNGKTWEDEPLGQATGDKGDSIFNDIDCSNEDYVFITLSDGQTIKLPTWGAKEAISNIVSNVRSMIYIPQYSDGQTRVKDGVTEFDFQILPKKYASVVAENWESLLSIKSTYAITRAMTFNDLPILSCVADETNGIVTLTVSCASLSIEYYYGAQSVNAALYLSNGNEEIASEYISFAPYYQPDEMWYTTTDGKIVTPYDANALDVTIISNTYENGKGVIKFDGDLTNIGKNAFKSKKTLSSVMIPHKVTTINDSAFGSCTSLMKIYCKPSDPPAIYLYYKFYYESLSSTLRSVFERISGMKIYVPAKYYEKYAAYTGVSTSNSDKVMQDNWGAYHSYIEPLYLLEE